ncbi:hypothetical protein ABVT39_008134 [Epinephelus coioides]
MAALFGDRRGTVKSSSPVDVELAAGPKATTIESMICSSTLSWYSMDILPSSSLILWLSRWQLSQPGELVNMGGPHLTAAVKKRRDFMLQKSSEYSWSLCDPLKKECNSHTDILDQEAKCAM